MGALGEGEALERSRPRCAGWVCRSSWTHSWPARCQLCPRLPLRHVQREGTPFTHQNLVFINCIPMHISSFPGPQGN